jgi:lycopene beta-cyclase
MKHYDLAVIGGGLAGLSLLYHFERAGKLDGKRVALIDPERKAGHDRTWSFWEREPGPFEELVYHRWPRVTVSNSSHDCTCVLAPYTYKLIRSTEWYAHVNELIDTIAGLERHHALATDIESDDTGVSFRINGQRYTADHAYSSRPHPLDHREVAAPYLDQHFRGWVIETEEDTFDPAEAALMDFRTPQEGESRFFYVLPSTKRRALVEIAIFSNNHLPIPEYDRLITNYIAEHWTRGNYEIVHTEDGNIPMTTYDFPLQDGRLTYIGLGGGAARPSTGYTFFGLQQQLMRMAADFPRAVAPWSKKHLLYDATLLRILQEEKLPGDEVFVNLFRDNPAPRVLAFLNGESGLIDDLRLMSTTEIGVFGRTFVGEVFGPHPRPLSVGEG